MLKQVPHFPNTFLVWWRTSSVKNLFSRFSSSFFLLVQVLWRDNIMAPSTNINPSYTETDVGLTLVICFIKCCDPHQLQEFSSTACLLLKNFAEMVFLGKMHCIYVCKLVILKHGRLSKISPWMSSPCNASQHGHGLRPFSQCQHHLRYCSF